MFCCYRDPFIVRCCTKKKYLVISSAQVADTCETNKSKCKHSYRNELIMFLNKVENLLYHAVGKTQFSFFTPDQYKETVSLEATIGEEQNCTDSIP